VFADQFLHQQVYQPNLSAIQQCFSLTINQPTVLFVMTYQPNEQLTASIEKIFLVVNTNYDLGSQMETAYSHPKSQTMHITLSVLT